ncbi:hypothetical protein A1Q1_02518 [Trichosporon asahii var. asahii CBS 2479]|uniref:Uncharacterized protein n=1 Tax=Trichosporon asahii var. asahii (strain ATCC 90039 / CBS 2479 / JCM 2466 / KCTC 7840 / NBRC 103889/ NCYC 2677 / UAMH 7654) TaxID=1186058 RepID=J6F062_TRIAS|nr:hypothetical protein A1Q1_02518 [Trichosporon asahii var. asahii CBS 2479]EJT48497.1 hypothetical protein A1Q1_02518 [Trichosporon asahii var. asahii CBS 2479]
MEESDMSPHVGSSHSATEDANLSEGVDTEPGVDNAVQRLSSDAEADAEPVLPTSGGPIIFEADEGTDPSAAAPDSLPTQPNVEVEASSSVPLPGAASSQLAQFSDAENQPLNPSPEPSTTQNVPEFDDDCYCSDCLSDAEDDRMAIDGDMDNASEGATIDAASFPHIVDAIRDYAIQVSPLTVRRVHRAWRTSADHHLGRHIRLDLRAPGLHRNGRQEPYLWLFSSASTGIPFLKRSLGRPDQSELRRSRTDARRVARILDVHACTEFVKRPVDISDWRKLHTVRLVQGRGSVAFHTAHTMPNVKRIVFSDGPYDRNHAAACPPVEQMFHGRYLRTRRVVCNFRTPGNSDGGDIIALPRLADLVLILHGWGVIPGFDPTEPLGVNHPLDEIRGLAYFAALEGTRVTIVNAALADLSNGRRACNMGDVVETLTQMWTADLRDEEMADGTPIDEQQVLGMIEFISLQEYRERVGKTTFAIETMTDATAQVPQYS